jgi:hypothetical protein
MGGASPNRKRIACDKAWSAPRAGEPAIGLSGHVAHRHTALHRARRAHPLVGSDLHEGTTNSSFADSIERRVGRQYASIHQHACVACNDIIGISQATSVIRKRGKACFAGNALPGQHFDHTAELAFL